MGRQFTKAGWGSWVLLRAESSISERLCQEYLAKKSVEHERTVGDRSSGSHGETCLSLEKLGTTAVGHTGDLFEPGKMLSSTFTAVWLGLL